MQSEESLRQVAEAGDTTAMVRLGVAAARRGEVGAAERWYRTAAEDGDVDGMDLLGLLCEERGEVAEARHWYGRAAARDDTLAMQGLARLSRQRGRQADAERWYRRAADLGDTDAMVLLAELTDPADESWYRRAASSGNARALAVLTTRLRQRGESEEAEAWLRRAVETTGEPFFAVELGEVLDQRGEDAEPWYRRAAQAGDVTGMGRLGAVLAARGEVGEAERWYRLAVDAGRTSAMADLALLLLHRGEVAEAEHWWESAGGGEVNQELWAVLPVLEGGELDLREQRAARHRRVSAVLGTLAHRGGDVERAERCLRRAAELGDTQAMYELGMLLTRWGGADDRTTRASGRRPGRTRPSTADRPETWFTRAAEAGHPDAMFSLSALHKGRQEGEVWWNRAVEASRVAAVKGVEPPG